MRLFIAVNFDKATKENILAVQDKLRAQCSGGNFSRSENMHLTVLFIGECVNVSALRRIIASNFTEPFDIVFDRTGAFHGDLHWIGIRRSAPLEELYVCIRDDVRAAGLPCDAKESFSPHITLAREARTQTRTDIAFEPFSMRVNRVSLMKSERMNGKLTYTEVYGKSL